ncbi:TonB-dependent receptor [Brevundimonas sp. C43]|uniref:TonB-dependent receptor n=1 Tax=Brevundimonas sp. C43 TaxID=3068314 RepID=UPI00273D990D|nr:TonB-dependent receptor [Brevundimonas sp. C43]
MTQFNTRKAATRQVALAAASALAISMAVVGGAQAQVATSTIRGNVTDGATVEAGATIVARNVASGFTSRTTANAQGGYTLSGLRPGTYEITATTAENETASDTVSIGVGQVGNLDLAVASTATADADADAANLGEIVVTGRRLAEVRTPESATNVTTQQIQTLPQINRNFLNFAALAPGVRLSQSESEQTITAGGQRAESINAFIDGASLKSNVIGGGIAGQDDSRGNPFPQAAIEEFQVVSQNFKAEYEQASSAIVTAVTRSGSNDFHGEVFGSYRDQSFITQDVFSKRAGREKPDLEVKQYGAALGGPIIRDRLHFFGSYERKEEARATAVNLGRQNPAYIAAFGNYTGTFATPFEEDLYFGKLSFQPAEGHLIDLSVTYRDEFDTRGIGGANTAERRYQLNQKTTSSNLRYQWQASSFLLEAAIDYRNYNYNQQPDGFGGIRSTYVIFETDGNPALPGFQPNNSGGNATIINLGPSQDRQDITDEALTFRTDLTFNEIEAAGFHTIKVGAKYSRQRYEVSKSFGTDPLFYYDFDGRPETSGSSTVPYRVVVGTPFPNVNLENDVVGLYAQDDWQITDKLELNLGLRWDYESNANNGDYVTPQGIVDGLQDWIAGTDGGKPAGYAPSWFNAADYISDGSQRGAFKDAFQPRIGFSYDVFGDRNTVLFGGAGRYYDRVQFNFSFDEVGKPFEFQRELFFNVAGSPTATGGSFTDPIQWNSSYGTREGVLALMDQRGVASRSQAFLLKNDFEPPRTDQFNLGVRQRVGDWQTEFTLAYGKTENEFTWLFLNRCREPSYGNEGGGYGDNGGNCAPPPATNDYREYWVSDHNKEREFTALYVKLDKPYTRDSGWGVNIAYTLSKSEQNGGNDNFCYDCFSVETSPVRSSADDERHRVVASGTLDLPLDFQLSGILTLGSGTPYNVFDGTGSQFYFRPYGAYPEKEQFFLPNAFAYRNLDLRLTKNFDVPGAGELSVYVDAINVFNFSNYSGFDGGTGSATNPNPNFGRPSSVLFPTRSFQIGARYSF